MSDPSETNPKKQKISPEILKKIDDMSARLQEAKEEAGRAVLGQEQLIEDVIITLMSGGHALLVGVPGLAKTVLAEAISKVFGLSEGRVQFTPDIMPSDITGIEVLEENKQTGDRKFRFDPGPVFNQFFLADEINRGNTRTQAGLLQAMQEGKVTIGKHTHRLPKPFHVLATQNPIEQEGTNELPEAQKDRFLMEIVLTYPDRKSEGEIMLKTTGTQHSLEEIFNEEVDLEPPENGVISPKELKSVFNGNDLIRIQHLVRKLDMGEKPYNAILDIVRNARPYMRDLKEGEVETEDLSKLNEYIDTNVEYGPGTRALQAFALATKARALLNGRLLTTVDDVVALADPILRHRFGMGVEARGKEIDEADVIKNLIQKYQQPTPA